ncbi:MAG TPA: TRL domain-containing protein [Myxococcota bacterium]|nr:TRL domain-containing protein [Myxococcota bacterium]
MTRSTSLAAACALLLLGGGTGCAWRIKAPVKPPVGLIYTGYKAPMSVDFNQTAAQPERVGQSSVKYIGIPIPFIGYFDFAFGDASVAEAARNGGISRVDYVDYEFTAVLGVYSEMKTTVHGE